MQASDFQIRHCNRSSCGLRYPYLEIHAFGELCPRCGGETSLVNVYQRYPEQLDRPLDNVGQQIEVIVPIPLAVGRPAAEHLAHRVDVGRRAVDICAI